MDSNSVTKKKKNDSDRRKRNDLTLEKKIEIIEEIHRSGNVSATARLFNIGRSHAHKLKDQECTIREAYTSGASTRKRLNGSCGGASSTSVSKRKKESTANKHIRVRIDASDRATEEHQIDELGEMKKDRGAGVIHQSASTSSAAAQSHSESGHQTASVTLEANEGFSEPAENGTTTSDQRHTGNAGSEAVNTNCVLKDTESVRPRTEEDPASDHSADVEQTDHDAQPSQVEFSYDAMGPLSNISLRTPRSVELYEAAEGLLSLDAVPSPSPQPSMGPVHGSSSAKGKVVQFVLPTTVKPFNSPPDQSNAAEECRADEQDETATTVCVRHPDMSSLAGCEQCFQMYCLNCFCELSAGKLDSCELKSCVEGGQHSTFPVDELTQRLKGKLASNLELRLRENQQIKSEAEAILMDRINKLHQQRDKEVAAIISKYKNREDNMKSSFTGNARVKELDNHIQMLHSKMGQLESSTHGNQLGFIMRELKSIPTQTALPEHRNIGMSIVDMCTKVFTESTGLDFISKQKTSGGCYGVSWTEDGSRVLCAMNGGVEVRGDDGELIHKVDIDDTFSAHLMADRLYTQLSSSTNKKYLTYVGLLEEPLQSLLHEVEYEGDSQIHHISVSHNRLAVIDHVNKELRICKPDGAHMYNIQLKDMLDPSGVELLPADNSVLVTDADSHQLRKYRLEPDAAPVWTCPDLMGPTGVTADESGLLYVTSYNTGIIYLISPQGQKIKELNHPMLKESADNENWIHDISVSDGRMVVAYREEGVMYFNLV